MTPEPISPSSLLPPGCWTSHGRSSRVGIRFGSHQVHVRGSVEDLSARLVVDRSGAATLTGQTPERPLFELCFHADQIDCSGASIELDALLTVDVDPVRVVARGSLHAPAPDRRRLVLETVFDRRQLHLDWNELDDEVTLYADLVLDREEAS